MPPVRAFTFQLERFEWVPGERLELAGRWEGLRGRQLGHPVLAFEAGGERHRLPALPGGQLRADAPWTATFAWAGGTTAIERAELEVGRSLVVDLPAPRRRRPRAKAPPAAAAVGSGDAVDERLAAAEERLEAERAESDRRLERSREETAVARDQLTRLREEFESTREDLLAQLAETHREIAQLREDLATAAEETETALAAERSTVAGLRDELAAARADLERTHGLLEHRDSQLGATRAGLEREREELRGARGRIEELAEELERERWEASQLRERLAEATTEAHDAEAEWPLEPPPLTEMARRRGGAGEGTFVARPGSPPPAQATSDDSAAPPAEPASDDTAPGEPTDAALDDTAAPPAETAADDTAPGEAAPTDAASDDTAVGEAPPTQAISDDTALGEVPPADAALDDTAAGDATGQEDDSEVDVAGEPTPAARTSHAAESNGDGVADAPPVQVWAARVSGEQREEDTTRTLEAVREKGSRALSALLGRSSPDEEAEVSRPRPHRSVATARGTAARRPPRTRTVRQHSREALWAMRIAAVAVLLVLIVLLAVVLKVVS